MTPLKIKTSKKTHPLITFNSLSLKTLGECWNFFIFSSIIAILFNTFYPYGIPLKTVPEKHAFLAGLPTTNIYVGWNKNPVKKTQTLSSSSKNESLSENGFQKISLMGAKNRFDKKSVIFLDARSPSEYQEG